MTTSGDAAPGVPGPLQDTASQQGVTDQNDPFGSSAGSDPSAEVADNIGNAVVDSAPDGDEKADQEEAVGFEDMLPPGGRRSWVVGSVRAQASFVGATHIGSVVIGDDRHHTRYR
jgi:hypothetical protein